MVSWPAEALYQLAGGTYMPIGGRSLPAVKTREGVAVGDATV